MKQFLLLLMFTLCNSNILKWEFNNFGNQQTKQRNLPQKDKIEQYIQSFNEIMTDFKKNKSNEIKEVQISDQKDENKQQLLYDIVKDGQNVGIIIGSQHQNNQEIKITFENQVQTMELILSKQDPQSIQAEIEEDYIEPFILQCKEIILDKTKVVDTIKQVIESVKTDNENPNFQKIKEDENGIKATISINKKNNENANIIELLYQLNFENQQFDYQMSIEIESKETEIKKDDQEKNQLKMIDTIVKFASPFFFSEFSVTVPTETFIKKKTENILLHVSKNFNRMFIFTANPMIEQNEDDKPFDCAGVEETIETKNSNEYYLKKKNDKELEIFLDEKNECQKENVQIAFECTDDNGTFTTVEITIADKKFVQSFLKQSLYSMKPVSQTFFEEVTDFATRILCPKVPDDSMAFVGDEDESAEQEDIPNQEPKQQVVENQKPEQSESREQRENQPKAQQPKDAILPDENGPSNQSDEIP